MPKRMRLPNGFGQITKLKQRLRKPYRAMVTVGFTDQGKPICKLLKPVSYFSTYNDAYLALAEYHRNPYDLNDASITVKEIYERWKADNEKKLSANTVRVYRTIWNNCSMIYNLPVKECKVGNIKQLLDQTNGSDNTKKRIKMCLGIIFDYAIGYDLIDKNPARAIKQNLEVDHKAHLAFTEDEISILWDNIDVEECAWIIVQIYTGLRPTELIELRTENINLEEGYMIGGMKTKAGTNRIIPIHPKIENIIRDRMSRTRDNEERIASRINGETLFETSYYKIYGRWENIIKTLGLNPAHKMHDGRKTFVTLAKKYNMDEYAIKRIVGHAIEDITENTYTERSIEWLKEEINKII